MPCVTIPQKTMHHRKKDPEFSVSLKTVIFFYINSYPGIQCEISTLKLKITPGFILWPRCNCVTELAHPGSLGLKKRLGDAFQEA